MRIHLQDVHETGNRCGDGSTNARTQGQRPHAIGVMSRNALESMLIALIAVVDWLIVVLTEVPQLHLAFCCVSPNPPKIVITLSPG